MATNSEAAAQARGRFLNQLNSRGIKTFRKEKGKNAAEVYWVAQKNKTYLIYILYSAADIKWWGMNEPVLKRLDQTHPSKYFCALVTDTDEVAILGPKVGHYATGCFFSSSQERKTAQTAYCGCAVFLLVIGVVGVRVYRPAWSKNAEIIGLSSV